jgi:hypothetical protein
LLTIYNKENLTYKENPGFGNLQVPDICRWYMGVGLIWLIGVSVGIVAIIILIWILKNI